MEVNDQATQSGPARWIERIRKARKTYKEWLTQAQEAYSVYWVEEEQKSRFPLFWANTEIQHSAVLANAPKAEVRRRNTEAAGVEKEAAQVLERAVNLQFDIQDLEDHLHSAVTDYLVAACGSCRVLYNPVIQRDEDGNPIQILSQGMGLEHIPFNRLVWEPNKAWENVDWISIEHLLDAGEYKTQFPGKPIPENGISGEGSNDQDNAPNPQAAKYETLFRVYEIWHKPTRRIFVVAEGVDEFLEVRNDNLNLTGFFPVPRPMLMNVKRDELIPKPDYEFIKSQLKYVNRLTRRIDKLTDAIRDVGFYDDSFEELVQLNQQPDGTWLPLRGLAERLAQAGGGKSMDALVAKLPVAQMAGILQHLKEMREDAKQQVYEITGISDIVRGATDPDETAAAQKMKGQWAGVRFGRKQKEVTRFCRDVIRMMAEIVGEHFQGDILTRMTGVEVVPEIEMMLSDDVSRTFAIDIETDSTLAADEVAERESRLEMLTAVGEFLTQAMPAMQTAPELAPLFQQMLLFLVRSYKHGAQLEDEIQQLMDANNPVAMMQQQLQQAQQQIAEMEQVIQQGSQQLQQVNERQEQREDLEAQSSAAENQASAQLKQAQAYRTVQEAQQPQLALVGA